MRFITALVSLAGVALARPEEDRMFYLPEMGLFDQYGAYSGYLNI